MNKKKSNYTGVIVSNSLLTAKMLEDLANCVRGNGEPVLNTNVIPEHVLAEHIRAGLPAEGLYDGMWICSEEFKGNWCHILDADNNRTLIVFPKRVAAKYFTMYPNCTKRTR